MTAIQTMQVLLSAAINGDDVDRGVFNDYRLDHPEDADRMKSEIIQDVKDLEILIEICDEEIDLFMDERLGEEYFISEVEYEAVMGDCSAVADLKHFQEEMHNLIDQVMLFND